MLDPLAFSLARQFLTHSANGFARFVTWVSFVGLTLGVLILTLVVTVMNGFDHELKVRLLSSLPHITAPHEAITSELMADVNQHAAVSSSTTYFQGLGALVARNRVYPVTLYAVSNQGAADLLSDRAAAALSSLQADPDGILLGRPLARAMGLVVGDQVPVITARIDGNSVAPTVLNFTLAGTFELGAEPDYNLVMLNLEKYSQPQWAAMGELGLRIQLFDALGAQTVMNDLSALQPHVEFRSWQSQYGELFRAVQLEKSMMFVLLFLVVAIAAFNIIAGQSMLVNDKRRSIAILRTMGCNEWIVRQVFLIQGAIIGLIGTLLGILLGVWVANYVNELLDFVEYIAGVHLLDGSLFVEVPILVMYSDLFFIAAICLLLCWLAAWVPASRAAAIDPVEALH